MLESKENAIEFLYGDKTATCTFCSPKYVNKIKKLVKDRSEECKIVAENEDGSIVAHIPVKWIKIQASRILSEEQREEMSIRFKERLKGE